jgi:hypothetical protein
MELTSDDPIQLRTGFIHIDVGEIEPVFCDTFGASEDTVPCLRVSVLNFRFIYAPVELFGLAIQTECAPFATSLALSTTLLTVSTKNPSIVSALMLAEIK